MTRRPVRKIIAEGIDALTSGRPVAVPGRPPPHGLEHMLRLLAGIVEEAGDHIAALDIDYRFTVVNQAYREEFQQIFGCPVHVGDRLQEVLSHLPEQRDGAVRVWEQALRGEAFTLEWSLIDLTGKPRVMELRFSPIRDEHGSLIGAVEISTEITRRRMAEAELREANETLEQRVEERTAALEQLFAEQRKTLMELSERERRFAQLADVMPQIVWITDAEGHGKYFNRRWTEFTGLPSTELLGADWSKVLHPEEADWIVAKWTAALRSGTLFESEHRFRRHDGEYRWHLVRSNPVRDDTGRITQWFGTCTDIHDARTATMELRRSEEHFRTLADNITQLAWMADSEGWLYWLNKRWFDYTGATLDEMKGGGWRKVAHPDHVERVVEKITQSFTTGAPWEDCFPLRGRDGEYRWFLSRAVPVRDESGNLVRWLGTSTDLEYQKRAEDQLLRLNEELAVAHEKALAASRAKSSFLANMSHELRTPLNAIIGYAELLSETVREGETDSKTLLDDFGRIEESGRHLLRLVSDILDLSKIEAGRVDLEWAPVNVERLLDEMGHTGTTLAAPLKNCVHVEKDGVRQLPSPFVTDENKLRQVLLNLISNACKFTQEGDVTLRTGARFREGREWVIFEVTDTGIGISPDNASQLFQEFVHLDASTTRNFGGSGLGLAISQRLCARMGGVITVDSLPHQGATFTVWLPTAPGEVSAA